MHRVRSSGGIVLGDAGTIALVRHKNNTGWYFPKGRLDEGETDEQAARREIAEETGLTDLELIDDLGEYERPRQLAGNTDDPETMKVIKMYLFAAPMHAELFPTLEIEEARWASFWDIGKTLENEKDKVWFASVAARVRQAIQRD